MKLITITQPAFFEGEAEAITSLFDAGLEILHLRKPGASYEDMEQLLNRLPPEYLKRIVTHEHFQLASFRNLKGIHLNGRNPAAPAGFTGHISRSCHSLEEVVKYKATCDYVFLSPIYDSISKEGYLFLPPSEKSEKQERCLSERPLPCVFFPPWRFLLSADNRKSPPFSGVFQSPPA